MTSDNSSLIFILFLSYASEAQPKKSILLKNRPIINLIDSISHTSVVQEIGGMKEWTKAFSYINDISVSEITYWSDSLKVKHYLTIIHF